jgi:hypothetical protein
MKTGTWYWNSHDIDSKFNTFLNIFLRLFEVSFPTKTQKKVFENNEWITKGIKTSCRYKSDLYLNCRSSDKPNNENPLQEILQDINSSN